MELLVILIILGLIVLAGAVDKEPNYSSGPNVSLNHITYPNNIKCECSKEVRPTPESIDSSTWDLKCECGKIAYKHPFREERSKQLDDMLGL